jgi:flagellar basal-body rod protein FlgB
LSNLYQIKTSTHAGRGFSPPDTRRQPRSLPGPAKRGCAAKRGFVACPPVPLRHSVGGVPPRCPNVDGFRLRARLFATACGGSRFAPCLSVMLDGVAGSLEQYMTLLADRQKLVAANIANADTPGYKTKDIDFQTEFRNALDGAPPNITEVQGLTVKNDGNNVSLDREARLLAENDIRFNIASNLLRGQIQTLKLAIEGGSSS